MRLQTKLILAFIAMVLLPLSSTLFASIYDMAVIVPEHYMLAPVNKLQSFLLIVWLIAVVFVIPVAWLVSRRITRPIATMRTTAECIAEGDFSRRVVPTGSPEWDQLALAFNHMIEAVAHREAQLKENQLEFERRMEEQTVTLVQANESLHMERRHLELQLAQAQKLETIGQLAAGVAHEINTPIQFVCDNLHFLQRAFGNIGKLLNHHEALVDALGQGQAPEVALQDIAATSEDISLTFLKDEIPDALTEAIDGTSRVAEIVQAMKAFSHPGDEEKTAIDLNKAITNTLTVARNEWKYVAELETDFDAGLPLVPCLPGAFNQVVLNLIVNAAHAIGDTVGDGSGAKGTITIRTRHDESRATVEIVDTGTGIPAHAQGQLFDPFFTTKEVGKGTGQGLAIAHDVIVNKHGGALTFETEEGWGTTFCISLPLSDGR